MLPNEIREQIEFEIEEIESLFELYKEELFGIKQKPDLFELTAFAGILARCNRVTIIKEFSSSTACRF